MKKPATQSSSKLQANKLTDPRDRITQQDFEELKETFDLFDEDGSGTIDPEELDKVFEELGLKNRNPTVGAILEEFKARNKALNFDDFLNIVVGKVGDTKSRDGLQKVFDIYDRDGAEFIDIEKFKQIARELGETMNETEIDEMMHNAFILNNTTSNEAFNFEEFYAIVTRPRN